MIHCYRCRDKGSWETPGAMGQVIGVGFNVCDCPAGDEHRARMLVDEIYSLAGISPDIDATAVANLLLKYFGRVRQASYSYAADLMRRQYAHAWLTDEK